MRVRSLGWIGCLIPALVAAVIACGTPPAPVPTPTPVPAATSPILGEDSKPPLLLRLELPAANWRASDAITGKATLSLTAGDSLEFTAGGGTFGWRYEEVGGDRQVDGPPYPSCDLLTLHAGQSIERRLGKAGGYGADAGPTDFARSFLDDRLIHLPVGDWRITTYVDFGLGHDPMSCASDATLSASVVIHVSP